MRSSQAVGPKRLPADVAAELQAAGAADPAADREGYLLRLRRLAEECRQSPPRPNNQPDGASVGPLAAEVAALREAVNSMALVLEEMKASRTVLEARLAVLERSVPSAQVWRDLIQSIRSIREVVSQMQQNKQAGSR